MIGLAMIMVYDTTIVDGIYNPIYPLVNCYTAIENGYLQLIYPWNNRYFP